MMWSGSNLKMGYSGQLLITFDADQFMSTGDGPFLNAIYSHAINQLGINDHGRFTQNIIFTTDNWNIPQPVTIIGIEDYIVDDNTTNSIGITIKSADSVFNGLTDNFTVSVIDSTRIIPISFSATNPSVTEGTDNSSNSVALAFRPRSNVTVSFTSQDTGEFRISDTLTFSPDNWVMDSH